VVLQGLWRLDHFQPLNYTQEARFLCQLGGLGHANGVLDIAINPNGDLLVRVCYIKACGRCSALTETFVCIVCICTHICLAQWLATSMTAWLPQQHMAECADIEVVPWLYACMHVIILDWIAASTSSSKRLHAYRWRPLRTASALASLLHFLVSA